MLMIIETHPIQYHAPVWHYLNQVLGIPVTVVYGSYFSVEGYRDKEFGISIAWDADLLEVYKSIFCPNHVLAVQKMTKKITIVFIWQPIRNVFSTSSNGQRKSLR